MGFLRRQLRGIILALLLGTLPLYFALKRPDIPLRGPIAWYDRTVLWIVSPVLKGIRFLQDSASGLLRHYLLLVRTEKENEILRRRLQEIQGRGAFFESLSQENRRLAALVGFQETRPYETIPARVLAYPPLGEFRLLTIDQGALDGVRRGAAVVVQDGLVGRIVRAEKNLAQVLLITDPTSAVDARVQRTGARGLVVGRSQGIDLERELFIAAFEYWSGSQEVAEKDLVVTSGLDRSFPAEIPIGHARNLKKSGHEVFLKGEVIPAVDFHKLREVLVVKLP